MMNLKRKLKNVLLVTILEKKANYGTEAKVVEFGCMRSVAGGTLLMVTCVTFASRWPSFPKISCINKFQYRILFVAQTPLFVL